MRSNRTPIKAIVIVLNGRWVCNLATWREKRAKGSFRDDGSSSPVPAHLFPRWTAFVVFPLNSWPPRGRRCPLPSTGIFLTGIYGSIFKGKTLQVWPPTTGSTAPTVLVKIKKVRSRICSLNREADRRRATNELVLRDERYTELACCLKFGSVLSLTLPSMYNKWQVRAPH